MTLRFIDLFAGVGGTRLAFESENFECVFSSEWDHFAQLTYEANFNELPRGDISSIASIEIPNFDILVAGFPCQPFSGIGLQQGFEHETQGTLFYEIARILNDKRPQAFLLENVKGLLTNNGGSTWTTIQRTLNQLGYTTSYAVLDSSHFGVPQKRLRVYVVGFSDPLASQRFEFPSPTEEPSDFAPFVEWGAEGYEITPHLQQSYIYKSQDGRPQVIKEDWHGPIKTLVSSYYKIQRWTGTFVQDGPTGLRLLSRHECLAAMGFPRNFVLPTSRSRVYRHLGNSVAVPVLSQLAKQIRSALGADQL
jgi:DNA (cytosine-5)-methyltransferase 1